MREKIDTEGETKHPFWRSIVVGAATWKRDRWFTQNCPAISIGGPKANDISKEWIEYAKANNIRFFRLGTGQGVYLSDPRPRIVIWGEHASQTRSAVEKYMAAPEGLMEFLGNAWTKLNSESTLTALPRNRDEVKGNLYIGTQYNIHGQVAAAGTNAHAQDMSLSQVWIPVEKLATDLATLKIVMEHHATNPHEKIAVSAIAAAEQSVRHHHSSKATEDLRRAGKWALDISEQIPLPVATKALKDALGLS